MIGTRYECPVVVKTSNSLWMTTWLKVYLHYILIFFDNYFGDILLFGWDFFFVLLLLIFAEMQ